MKKIILQLLEKHFQYILEKWAEKIDKGFSKKLSGAQTKMFVKSSLKTLMTIFETADYTKADNYLIEIYNLFNQAKLNLLEISQLFSNGRFTIISALETDKSYKYDPLILIGFIDEIIEQVYARYGIIHQKAKLKELESDRNRLAAKLELNQQYLKNILKTSNSAIIVIDNDENFISWNKGAEEIFGYTEDEVIGKPSTILLPEGSAYSEELKIIQDEVKNSGYIRLNDTERRTKSGELISVNLNVTSIPGSDGIYRGRTVIINDFTEMKKLQRQVDQSEKLAVIGQLAAGIAHEIGNPLTSISSLVQILQRKTGEDFTREKLSVIRENIDRISKIVRELVDFSKPPGHDKTSININDVIKTATGIVKYDKRVKKVSFITELDHSLPPLYVVPDQLLQVFVNILLNALDATGGEGEITVKSYMENEKVNIEFIDNGCGIEKKDIDKIFDPFFTTKDVGKGTGLGLAVSYGIIKKERGEIVVRSIIGKGSNFKIILPVAVHKTGK